MWCYTFLVLKCRKRLPWCLSQPLLEIKTPATIMDDQKVPENYYIILQDTNVF